MRRRVARRSHAELARRAIAPIEDLLAADPDLRAYLRPMLAEARLGLIASRSVAAGSWRPARTAGFKPPA